LLSLAEINHALSAWLSQEYHQAVHSETGQPPGQRYDTATRFQRSVRLSSVIELFHRREQRVVHRDFSDVTIGRQHFAVDPAFRGDRLEVRFDPYFSDDRPQEVQLYHLDGQYLGVGRLYQRQKGHHGEQGPPETRPPIEPSYLDALQADHRRSGQQQREAGLDFHSARERGCWPLTSFAARLAKLLGRGGGLSALSSDELSALRDFHCRHDRLNERLLRDAVAAAESPTIPHVLFQLQSLFSEGDF